MGKKKNGKVYAKKHKMKVKRNKSFRGGLALTLSSFRLSPLKPIVHRKFIYDCTFPLAVAANTRCATQFFNCSDIFDPDFTNNSRNDSVAYFTTFMGATSGLYRQFLVHSCKVECEFYNATVSTQANIVISLSSLGTSDYNIIWPSEMNQRSMSNMIVVRNTGGRTVKKVFYVKNHDVLHKSKKNLEINENGGTYNASPPAGSNAYIGFTVGNALETVTQAAITCQCIMRMTFYTSLAEPNLQQ